MYIYVIKIYFEEIKLLFFIFLSNYIGDYLEYSSWNRTKKAFIGLEQLNKVVDIIIM